VEVLVDTGFNASLTLPTELIHELGSPFVTRQQGELADGSLDMFDVYEVTIFWNGAWATVEVEAVDAQPLLGMELMQNLKLEVEVKPGGSLKLSPLA
jgi:clan AA aspartic protease